MRLAKMAPSSPDRTEAEASPVARRGSWAQTARTVAWSFLGIRRSTALQEDVQKLNPLHVIVVGLVAAALFVGGLVVLVRWVVGSGVAGG